MRSATVAEIEAEAVRFQTEVGEKFTVAPNGYGVRVECNACHESATQDRAYSFHRVHVCTAADTTTAARLGVPISAGHVIRLVDGNRYLVTGVNPKSYAVVTEQGGMGNIPRRAADPVKLPIEQAKDTAWLGRVVGERLVVGQRVRGNALSDMLGRVGVIEKVNARTYNIAFDGDDVYRMSHNSVEAI